MDRAAKPVILVVEDDPDLGKILSLQLNSEGFNTIVAMDGADAYTQIQQIQPACVILDLMMPVMDGFSFLKRIRSLNHTVDVPVIVLTASQDDRYRRKSHQYLADMFMKKPYDLQELTVVVRNLIEAAKTSTK